MLYEDQVHAFLERCERAVGRPLVQLRSAISSKRKHGPLWELVTLYVASLVGTVDHEPGVSSPDVLLSGDDIGSVWIEARHAESRDANASEEIHNFADWVHLQIRKHGINPSDWCLTIESAPEGSDPQLPPTQVWKAITRMPEWRQFMKSLRGGHRSALVTLEAPELSCVVRATFSPNPHGFLSSGFTVPAVVREIRDHAVYRAIEAKALQAKSFDTGTRPLVVCIGNTHESSFFSPKIYPGVSAKEAALAALHDTSSWHPIAKANLVPRSEGQNHRVSGAGKIAGVLLVSIEDRLSSPIGQFERTAQSKLILNLAAEFPLSESQQRTIANLPFHRIRFATDATITRALLNRSSPLRADHSGKVLCVRSLPAGGFEIDIPQQDILQMLSGKSRPQDVLGAYSDIGRQILHRLADEPPILSIECIAGNAERAEPDMLRIRFGPPRPRLF